MKKRCTFAAAFRKKFRCLVRIIFQESVRQAVSLAQLVEQLTLNQRVEGSSPSGDTLTESEKLISITYRFLSFLIIHSASTNASALESYSPIENEYEQEQLS